MNLCELINAVKDRDGLTWRQLVDRARAKGAPPPTGIFYLGDPNRPMYDFPRTKTIMGLAAALEVEPKEVAAAALRSLGLHMDDLEVEAKAIEVRRPQTGARSGVQSDELLISIRPTGKTTRALVEQLKTAQSIRIRSSTDTPEIGHPGG